MKISVIIPFYNADRFIGRMLDSLLRQDLKQNDYEIIVVDDGSKEEPMVLKDYVNKYFNIRYIRQENAGPGAARNTGLKIANGEFIFFCDSDDCIAENCLGYLYDIAKSKCLDMLFFNVLIVKESDIAKHSKKNLDKIQVYQSGKDFLGSPIWGIYRTMGACQFIIAKSLICKCDLHFPSNMIVHEDSCFLIDAILVANRTAIIDADVYFYIQNPQSLFHSSGKIKQPEKWANNRLMFITKIHTIINDSIISHSMPKACLDNLQWIKNEKSHLLIRDGYKSLSIPFFNMIVSKVKRINSFPRLNENYSLFKRVLYRPNILRLLNILFVFKRRNVKK